MPASRRPAPRGPRARRRGWACRAGAGSRRRRRRAADRTRRRGPGRSVSASRTWTRTPRSSSASTRPSCSRRARSRSTGRRKPYGGIVERRRRTPGPGALTRTSRSGAVIDCAPYVRPLVSITRRWYGAPVAAGCGSTRAAGPDGHDRVHDRSTPGAPSSPSARPACRRAPRPPRSRRCCLVGVLPAPASARSPAAASPTAR